MKLDNSSVTTVVVDDFLADPDAMRIAALNANYKQQGSAGVRSAELAPADEIAEKLTALLGRSIDWTEYPMNGRFQYCTAKDPIVYHTDTQRWAGAIFLTPGAPIESGVQLLRSRVNGKRKCASKEDAAEMFEDDHFDGTRWDTADWIGNVYNRLVLWDGRMAHAASTYFGNKISNARLFITLFFD